MQRLAIALLLALTSQAVSAQQPTTAGFLVAHEPRDREAFEAGYRRHLEWHRARGDSLTWLGWDVLVGERPGVFVDGVFGVPFAALDVRVDPAGDRADAAANVEPHADPGDREMLALRPDLSSATPLEEDAPTPLVQVVRYGLAPSAFSRMEAALGALRSVAPGGSLLPYTVYERVAGAEPGFVLMVWRSRLATFDEHGRNPAAALRGILAQADIGGLVTESASEVWLYRPDLTYLAPSKEDP